MSLLAPPCSPQLRTWGHYCLLPHSQLQDSARHWSLPQGRGSTTVAQGSELVMIPDLLSRPIAGDLPNVADVLESVVAPRTSSTLPETHLGRELLRSDGRSVLWAIDRLHSYVWVIHFQHSVRSMPRSGKFPHQPCLIGWKLHQDPLPNPVILAISFQVIVCLVFLLSLLDGLGSQLPS